MNLEMRLTRNIMYYLVAVKCIRLPTSCLYKFESTLYPLSSLLNFKPVTIEVGAALQFIMLNIFKISLAYLDYEMNIHFSF
jgi:hypothetical protein